MLQSKHSKGIVVRLMTLAFIGALQVNSNDLFAQGANIYAPDEIKAKMLQVADWQMKNSNNKKLNDWTNGAFYSGVFAAYQTTGSSVLMDSMMAMGERMQWLAARRFDHADDYVISQTYIDLYRVKKDKKMIQSTLDSLAKMKTTVGNEIKRHGINWWWCDALFMQPPTLAKLSKTLKDPSYLVWSDSLFRECYRLLYNDSFHLFARDASYLIDANGNGKKESNGKKVFWSRGNGWVMAGLVNLLKEMPKRYAGRAFYETLFKEMANSILTLQQEDGLWRTSLLDPAAYPGGEGSGTGFYCYALAWGINQKILDKPTFLLPVKKSWEGLNTLVYADGKIGWVQPIGADPKRNFGKDSWESYGAGAFLLAASEMIKLKK